MPKEDGTYEPPPSGDLPEGGKKVLSRVYSDCRSGQKVTDKEKCAKIAWGAVRNAGFKKEDQDKLGQILKGLNEIKGDLEKGKARRLQMRGYAKRHQEQKKEDKKPKKEIKEKNGKTVITGKDIPAGMGRTQEWQYDE